MADYQISGAGVIRNDGACIPSDPENRDWAAYLAWCDAGGVADPEPEPMPDPGPDLALVSASLKIATVADLTPDETVAAFPIIAQPL